MQIRGIDMGNIFVKILNMGLTAGWLILAVVILRFFLKRAPRWIICLLWALVAVRLICPFSPESALSLIPSGAPLPEKIMTGRDFAVNTGINIVDAPVNAYLGDHYYEGVTVSADNGNRMMNLFGRVWAAGVVLMLLYSLVSYYRLYKATRVCICTEKNIYRCDGIDTPFILGIVKPRIYLPSGMKEEQAAYVTAHERAHLRRRDHWWKPAGFLLLSVYWFQPLCWVSYILLCRDIELACDEKVIRTLDGKDRKAYAEALLSCSIRQSVAAACPLAFGEVGVRERVKNVLHYKKPAFWIILAAVVCGILAAVCFLTNPKEAGESTSQEEETWPDRKEMSRYGEQDDAESGQSSRPEQGAESGQTAPEGERDAVLTELLTDWRSAFCERDAEAMAEMMTLELAGEMLEGSAGNYSFGFSSPWPRDADTDSFVYRYDEESAVVYYYAHTSDPHLISWKEELRFGWEGDICTVTGEELTCYDDISSRVEFGCAYPIFIDGTKMDYTKNGLGETLNENALLSSSMVYRDLFSPKSAAVFLLNLSKDPEKVSLSLHEPEREGLVGLTVTFLEDQGTITFSMLQPYGENGIWVPVNYRVDVIARMMKVDQAELKALRFAEDAPYPDGIFCIGEIPEQKIRLYGYNDDEVGGQGVILEAGDNLYYYDWYYMSPRSILPDLYWDEARRELQISLHIYTGTGAAAQELHILHFDDAGTVQESYLELQDYAAFLEERIGWQYEAGSRELVLTDTESGEELARVTVSSELSGAVTGLELGMISSFTLGESVYFNVSPGYYGESVTAEYTDMPELTFKLSMHQRGNGDVDFELGERIS